MASLLQTLTAAARLLEGEAATLRQIHSLRGQWHCTCAADDHARARHQQMRDTAKTLRAAARYMRPNPLGGPAKVFDAIADRVRAGEDIDAVMADHGVQWAPAAIVK